MITIFSRETSDTVVLSGSLSSLEAYSQFYSTETVAHCATKRSVVHAAAAMLARRRVVQPNFIDLTENSSIVAMQPLFCTGR